MEFDFAKPFTYVFDDPDWLKKILIGGVILLIPILGWLWVMGFVARAGRNVMEGREKPLPDWDCFGDDVATGLKLVGVHILYALPLLILAGVFAAFLSLSNGLGSDSGPVAAMGINCLSIPLSLSMAVILPAPLMRVVATGRFSAAIEFAELWRMVQSNVGVYLLAVIVSFLGQMIGSMGLIACIVGILFTKVYGGLIQWHAYAQVWRMDQGGSSQNGDGLRELETS